MLSPSASRSQEIATRVARLIFYILAIPLSSIVLGVLGYMTSTSMPRWGTGRLGSDEVTLASLGTERPTLWVDARNADLYEESHLSGAILLNEDDWSELLRAFVARWDNQRVIVYCDTARCNDARAVARRLREDVGVREVYVLRGGWETLRNSSMPIEYRRYPW